MPWARTAQRFTSFLQAHHHHTSGQSTQPVTCATPLETADHSARLCIWRWIDCCNSKLFTALHPKMVPDQIWRYIPTFWIWAFSHKIHVLHWLNFPGNWPNATPKVNLWYKVRLHFGCDSHFSWVGSHFCLYEVRLRKSSFSLHPLWQSSGMLWRVDLTINIRSRNPGSRFYSERTFEELT